MQPSYGEITGTGMLWLYLINIGIVIFCVFVGVYFWCVLAKGRHKYAVLLSFGTILMYQILTVFLFFSFPESYSLILHLRAFFAMLALPSIFYSIIIFKNRRIFSKVPITFFVLYTIFIAMGIQFPSLHTALFYSISPVLNRIISFIIFLLTLCYFFYLSEVGKKNNRYITLNIIENIDETVIIYDKQNRQCYLHIGTDFIHYPEFITKIEKEIKACRNIPENFNILCTEKNDMQIFEGKIKLFLNKMMCFNFKISPIFRKGKYLGKILVVNDMTKYSELLEQLNNKNSQLKEALEHQREYVQVARRLVSEEERSRIMGIVNGIAGEYLQNLKKSIERLEGCKSTGDVNGDREFIEENDKMIQKTREIINEIRDTVKLLHYTN